MSDTRRWKRGEIAGDGRVFKFYAKNNGKEYDYWFENQSAFEQWKTHQRDLERRRYENPDYRARKNASRLANEPLKERTRQKKRTEESKAARREYRKRPHIRESQAAYLRKKRAEDPLFAMAGRLRTRTNRALRRINAGKECSTEEILGASWSFVHEYLASLFLDGMSWENRHLWHIDHIVPIASAKTPEDVYHLCHYTNLQPLWKQDNLAKGCRMPEK